MTVGYDCLVQIVQPGNPPDVRVAAMRGFAEDLGWTPSYEFQRELSPDRVTDHLIVEHGLENTAIISFLPSATRPTDLSSDSLRALLTLSYNNLIEWHLFVSDTEVRYVNNLTTPYADVVRRLGRHDTHFVSSDYFQEPCDRNVATRTIAPCDDLLINTISRWKRLISADYEGRISNEHISALMNLTILFRGCEDYKSFTSVLNDRRLLLEALHMQSNSSVDIGEVFAHAFALLNIEMSSINFLRLDQLPVFAGLDKLTAYDLFRDFYRPSTAPFSFNFAFMSKHALSRIYERYVALLEYSDDPDQLSFLKAIPVETASAKAGAVYTPQFIAGFFARYLRDNMTPRAFRELRAIDPACGSGIFLRSLLELQGSPFTAGTTRQSIIGNFAAVRAVDRDANACEATALSLALLHLVAVGGLPASLNVSCADAVDLALRGSSARRPLGPCLQIHLT